jgi:glycosyltransferase involved in cell wall biosynthesis
LGVKHILELNAPYPEERIMMEGSSLFLKRASEVEMTQLLTTHQIVVVSSSLRDYVLSRIGVGKKTITVTPNAVNALNNAVDDTERLRIRNSLGIADSTIVIGFVGSIFPYHGVDKLIESFAEIEQTEPHVHLLVVGTGHALSDLKRQVRSLRLGSKVTFTGEVPHQEVGKYIHTMDITVMANSNWYGSPVKIFEYGAACKPIIAPDIEPLRDVIDSEKDGLLVIPEHQELVKAMRRLVQMPDLRHQLGLSFQEKVFAHHTWKKMASRILMEEPQTQDEL